MSTISIESLIAAANSGAVNIKPLALKLRGVGKVIEAEALERLQDAILAFGKALRSAPVVSSISIASADISDLLVGGRGGPGELAIESGPPDYLPLGWFGARDSGTSKALIGIVSGLATTTTPHGLKIGDIVNHSGTSNVDHSGYFRVATVPLTTTYTATGLTGSSTGGTSTKQFQGGWLQMLGVGGTGFATAKFVADVDGSVRITDATITLNGTMASIVLDPNDGSIIVTSGAYIVTIQNGVVVTGVAAGSDRVSIGNDRIQILSTPYASALTHLAATGSYFQDLEIINTLRLGAAGQLLWGTSDAPVIDSSGHAWDRLHRDTQANLPVTTMWGAEHVGYLFYVTDFDHTLRWDGSGWEFAPGDCGSAYFVDADAAPKAIGWHECDGTTVNYLQSDGSTDTFVLPTYPFYVRADTPFDGTTTASAATIGDESAHTHDIDHDHGSVTSGANSATHTFSVGTGASITVAEQPHTHDVDVAAITASSGAGSTHTHSISGVEPEHCVMRKWFRQ